MLGERICNIDLDVVITGDMTALLTSKTADFVGWRCGQRSWNRIGGALWLLTTGTHQDVGKSSIPLRLPTWRLRKATEGQIKPGCPICSIHRGSGLPKRMGWSK